ncbi:formyltransferase family protein [Acidimicrobiia bacterium]|nr:formyltransferase family protein [Acidimicrobiia bacterium]
MKNILICSHREWSLQITENLIDYFHEQSVLFKHCKTPEDLTKELEKNPKYELILFIGWNEIISKSITDGYTCICLHPSLLPKYRGGSPIQHQMINGEKTSGVTIFQMNEGLDKGPVYFQKEFELKKKDLNMVFDEIIKIGSNGFIKLINEIILDRDLIFTKQDEKEATYFKRRSPEQSEIFIEDLTNYTAQEISNKINSLMDPYPNAFIKCRDGKKLFLSHSKYED